MSADDKQIAGNHYKNMGIQPWTYIAANKLGYFEGSAIKYITRWRSKGGVDDIRKAIHFLEKLIEVETKPEPTYDNTDVRPEFVVPLTRPSNADPECYKFGWPNPRKTFI